MVKHSVPRSGILAMIFPSNTWEFSAGFFSGRVQSWKRNPLSVTCAALSGKVCGWLIVTREIRMDKKSYSVYRLPFGKDFSFLAIFWKKRDLSKETAKKRPQNHYA